MNLLRSPKVNPLGESATVTGERETAWVEVGRFRARTEAEQHALVLVSRGIDCRLVPGTDGAVALTCTPADALRARRELAHYADENRQRSRPSLPARSLAAGLEGALAYCAVLFFLYGAPRRQAFSWDWWSAGAAQAGLIADGEWWRTLTALGLHADVGHLASNLFFGSGLGLLLAQLLGTGFAWLAILVSGGLGNALSALLQPAGHTAVGASTAVFGALGILAALAWKRQAEIWRLPLRRWLPFGAGLMLLAYLGFGGGRTDVLGHVAGFVTGGALGVVIAFGGPRLLQGAGAQWASGTAALTLLALGWILALQAHG